MAEPSPRHDTEQHTSAQDANLSNLSLGGEEFLTQMDAAAAEAPSGTTPPPTQAALGHYVLLKTHAQGGVGKVSLARDEVLGRTVALKEIRDDRNVSPEALRRFIREATITGQLEHPGTVPIYSLDYDNQGRPYYTMQFIEGQSLRAALVAYHAAPSQGKGGAFRKLLNRLVAVCHTVAYAHSKGVIHRDLKPENILLGEFGETLVVDWGLAKQLAGWRGGEVVKDESPTTKVSLPPPHDLATSPPLQTHVGQILGTPAFMSPEQAKGEGATLGPTTDIYSLGAILYSILTGKAPHEGGSWEVIGKLQKGSPPLAPRAVKPDVPRGLEAICVKAMSLCPEDRYATAQELAADLEHWLADEPVTAFAEPWSLRARRWLRRHRTLAASSIVALFVMAAALLVGLVAVSLEQRQTEQARREAQAHQRDAEEKYRLARAAADELLATLNDKLTATQNIHQVRREMLEKARQMYRTFLRENGDDPEVLARIVRIQGRLAMLLNDTGTPQEAGQAHQEAVRLAQELVERYPNRPQHPHLLAQERHNYAQWLHDRNRNAEAREHYEAAIALHRKLVTDHPREREYRLDLSNHFNNLGLVLEDQPGTAEAVDQAYRECERLRRELLQESPRSTEVRYLLSTVLGNRGRICYERGRYPEAEPLMRETVVLQQALAAENPDHDRYRQNLGISRNNLANLLRMQNRLPEAEAEYRASAALLERLVEDFPSVLLHRVELVRTQTNLAQMLVNMRRLREAEIVFRAALVQREHLAQREPDNVEFQDRLAATRFQLGRLLNEQDRPRDAAAPLRQALDIYMSLMRKYPEQASYPLQAARCQRQLSQALTTLKQGKEAEQFQRQAVAQLTEVVRRQSNRRELREEQADALDELGLQLQESEQAQEAIPIYRQSLDVRRKLLAETPQDAGQVKDIAGICCNLAHCLRTLGQIDEAMPLYNEGIRLLTPLPCQGPVRQYLANCYWGRAHVHLHQGHGLAALIDQHVSARLEKARP